MYKIYVCIKYRHRDIGTKSYILAYMCMPKPTFAVYMHVYCNEWFGFMGLVFSISFLMVATSDFVKYLYWRMPLGWGAFVLFLIDGPFLSRVNGNMSCGSFFFKSTNLTR